MGVTMESATAVRLGRRDHLRTALEAAAHDAESSGYRRMASLLRDRVLELGRVRGGAVRRGRNEPSVDRADEALAVWRTLREW